MPNEYSVKLDGSGRRVGIVVSRFNESVTRKLVDGAVECLLAHDVDEDSIDVYWVAGPRCDAQALERFREYVDHCFEGELELRMHQVERIEPEANGKVRGCICRVPMP